MIPGSVPSRKPVDAGPRHDRAAAAPDGAIPAIDGIFWRADAETFGFESVAGGVEAIMGVTAEAWLGQPGFWQSHLHPDDADRVDVALRAARRTCQPQRLSYRLIADDGRTVWIQDHIRPCSEGARPMIQGCMIDVTALVEERRQRDAHNARQAHFQALYDLVPVAIWEEDWSAILKALRSLRAEGVTDIGAHARASPGFVEAMLDELVIVSVNRAAVNMFRAESADELIRRAAEVFGADKPHSVFQTALDAIMRGQTRIEGVNTLSRLDGARAHVLYRIALPCLEDRTGHVIICEMDISAAHAANERFELVTRATSDVIWDFDIRNDTLWASDGLQRIFGLDPAEMSSSLKKWTDRIHPADVDRVMRQYEAILHRGSDVWEQEYRFRKGDGSYAVVRDDGFILRDGAGEAVRMVGSLVDVTEQRRAEERFRHVAQATSDIIFDQDIATNRVWVSEGMSKRFGYPPEMTEHTRDFWIDNLHPDDRDATLASSDAALASDAAGWEHEYRYRRSDGSYVPVLERASILRDRDGRAVRMIGNMVDLSDQKALEAQLRQAQRLDAIGQLTGGIAHDFNNLLTVILGNAELLGQILPSDSREGAMSRQVLAAAERAAELTQRLLAFARKQPLSPGRFDPNALIEGMRILIERSLTPAITLSLDLAEGIGQVEVDRAMFESALLNQCVNARDAMPEGGTLRITTEAVELPHGDAACTLPAGDYVRISVVDSGTGMDPETRSRAIEPFFTTKGPGAGSGLGLSMVYGFVQQSNGRMDIRSAPGAGSTIEILLPHLRDGAALTIMEPAEAAPGPVTASARIVIVEDDAQVRQHVRQLTRSMGYEVREFVQAAPALDLLQSDERVDLLLSDVVLPGGMSGRQLAEAALRARPGLPILLVSGYSEEMIAADGQSGPRVAFLRKPFRRRELAQRLAALLDDRAPDAGRE